MRPRFSNIAVMTLPVVCIILAAMWIRSHWRADTIYYQATPHGFSISSNDGGVTFGRREYNGLSLDDTVLHYYSARVSRFGYGIRRWAFAGFIRGDVPSSMGEVPLAYTFRDDYWTVPYWILFLATFVVSSISARARYRQWIARSRSRRGECTSCGYDMRASPSRCPECGKSVAAAAA